MSAPAPLPDPERGLYRRRRLMDMARLLPLLGVVLILLPLLWQPAEQGERATVPLGWFLFSVWLGLIGAAFLLTRALGHEAGGQPDTADGTPPTHDAPAHDPPPPDADPAATGNRGGRS